MLKLRAVLIDLDGTLVDSLNVYDKVFREVLKKYYNIEISEESLDKNGSPPEVIYRRILSKYNLENNLQDIFNKLHEELKNHLDEIKINKGGIELLNYLKEKNIKIGLVTSSRKEIVELILDNLKIKNIFDIIITGSDVKNQKPDPEPYILAIRSLKVLPDEALAIEDSIYGILSAKRAGINVIGVSTGINSKKELLKLYPYSVFKNLVEVLDFLKSILEVKE